MTTEFSASATVELNGFASSLLADVRGGRGVLDPGLVRYSGTGTVAGRAITAECVEGSLQAVFAALDQAKPGDFLVAVCPGPSAYLGEVLATHLTNLGLSGVIIDGWIRDRAAISDLPISIYAKGLYPHNQRRREAGKPLIDIMVGGVHIHPGDWVVGDDDGLVIIPEAELAADLAAARKAAKLEARVLEFVRLGKAPAEAVRLAQST